MSVTREGTNTTNVKVGTTTGDAARVKVKLYSTSTGSPFLGGTTASIRYSKDGGAYSDASSVISSFREEDSAGTPTGCYSFIPAQSLLNAVGNYEFKVSMTGADREECHLNVVNHNPRDNDQADATIKAATLTADLDGYSFSAGAPVRGASKDTHGICFFKNGPIVDVDTGTTPKITVRSAAGTPVVKINDQNMLQGGSRNEWYYDATSTARIDVGTGYFAFVTATLGGVLRTFKWYFGVDNV